MNQTQPKKKSSILSTIMLVVSLILIGGIKTLFKACTEMTAGNYMTCHWAEQTIFVIAICMAILSLLSLIAGDGRAKAAYSLSIIPLAAAAAFTPQYIIPLCTGADMRCKTIMQPATMVVSGVMAVLALIAFIVYRTRGSSEKKAIRAMAFEEGKASVPVPEVKPVEIKTSTAPPKETPVESKPSIFTHEEEPIKLEVQNDLDQELFPPEEAAEVATRAAVEAGKQEAEEEKGFFSKLFK